MKSFQCQDFESNKIKASEPWKKRCPLSFKGKGYGKISSLKDVRKYPFSKTTLNEHFL